MTRLLLLLLLLAPSTLLADEALYRLINERLSLMEQVAAYKWINEQPIAVPEREALRYQQRSTTTACNTASPLTPAAHSSWHKLRPRKIIQQCWFARWETGQATRIRRGSCGGHQTKAHHPGTKESPVDW